MRLAPCAALLLSAVSLPAVTRPVPPPLPPSLAPAWPVLQPGGGSGGGGPIPEPSTLLLVGTGLVGVALTTRLRRRAPK